ncbi:MAG TPA: response regulator transcription factor [Acidobacteriaceae bacterium]|jgi:DNA-binding NarL/FixJ family response regulator|nr:response regulator transcription factor [Acidobacteriaceae bacterium]
MARSLITTGDVRIGLLEFDPIRVTGLSEILTSRPAFEVVATDLASAFLREDLDLVMLLARKGVESYVLLGRLKVRQPELKAIVMSEETDDETIIGAISAGAKGWLEETASPEQVLQAVDIVLSGSIWAPRKTLSKLVDRALGKNPVPLRKTTPRFTERESEVLQQLVLARSNREIAHALSIREQTVKSYVARLMRKVGVDNRIALSMQAAEDDWWGRKSSESNQSHH